MIKILASKRAGPVLITLLLSVCVLDCNEIIARMGSDVILPCNCPHSSSLVSWQKYITIVYSDHVRQNETPEELQYHRRTRILENNCSLVLSQVQPSDEGEYNCYYQTSSFSSESVTLHVTAVASCEYKSGLYHCVASWGTPEGRIVWRLNGQSTFLHSVFFQKKLDHHTGLYAITGSANMTRNGTVTCEVETSGKAREIVLCDNGIGPRMHAAPESSRNVLLVSVVCGALVFLLIAICSCVMKHQIIAHLRKLVLRAI